MYMYYCTMLINAYSKFLNHGYIIVLVGTWTTLNIIITSTHSIHENTHNNNDKVNNQQTLPSK